MKISVEIDIEWLDENGGVDDTVNQKLLDAVVRKITEKTEGQISERIAFHAQKLVQAKTEVLINTMLERPITISGDSWGSKTEYDSVYDMVETRMTKLYEGKLSSNGKCEKDPLLANINSYVDSEAKRLLEAVKKQVEEISKKRAQQAVATSDLAKALEITLVEKQKRGYGGGKTVEVADK